MTDSPNTPPAGRLTALQGSALYVGAVLGTGVIALPALADRMAGPASLLAWLALVLLSAPLAATFAALGARHPDAGGVATYARLAFGERAAAVVGWCFYLAVPSASSAAALFGGAYLAAALGGGPRTTALSAAALMVLATLANAAGVRISGRIQLVLAGLLAALLLLAATLSLPQARLGNLTPFAPHGWPAVGSAAALLVWSFAGWEAITHLAAEFRRPARDLPRAAMSAVAVVGLLYLSVAFAVVAVLGPAAATSPAPLGELMARGLGGQARVLAAAAAVLLTLGTMNVYYAGAAKLGAALGRDGAMPAWLARGSSAGQVPRRSLFLLAGLAQAVLFGSAAAGVGTSALVQLSTGCFISVYVIGVASAVRLLGIRDRAGVMARVALVLVVLVAAFSGRYLIWPMVIAGLALLYLRLAPRDRLAAVPVSTGLSGS